MRPPRTHVPGIVYHVYARGVGGQDIVAGAEDWDELQALIAEVARACDVRLYAFCLMTNHYHLLLEVGAVPLSKFMQRIQTAWSRRFNIAQGRWGHVFQDRFKHRVCDSDAYFKWLLRYIHFNPVKAGMVSKPEGWRWSSFRQYIGEEPSGICEVDWPLSLFSEDGQTAKEAFLSFVETGKGETRPPRKLFDSRKRVLRPLRPRGSTAIERPSLKEILSQIAASAGVPEAGITEGSRVRSVCAARRAFVAAAFRVGHTLTSIAGFGGVSVQAASKLLQATNRR
jgi:REP element-mobilizing transposase RayT